MFHLRPLLLVDEALPEVNKKKLGCVSMVGHIYADVTF